MATSISLWSDEEYVDGLPGISDTLTNDSRIVVHLGDTYNFLCTLPSSSVNLIITSPPYNVGKAYEVRAEIQDYLQIQEKVIDELVRVLDSCGSICWQVGNYVKEGEVFPLDIFYYDIFKSRGLKLRKVSRVPDEWKTGEVKHIYDGRKDTKDERSYAGADSARGGCA